VLLKSTLRKQDVNTVDGCMWFGLRAMADFDVNYVDTSGFITTGLVSVQIGANCEMRNNFLLTLRLPN
jgi:hypothetical protein